ncbi:MAG: hypothetical protein IPN20_24110 [Haliscomenobacter sp.]|nr:hypothetical protein [Haliscomenobacter sp.]
MNSIFVIESLENERKTGKELHDDIINKFNVFNGEFYTFYRPVASRKEFLDVLEEIVDLTYKKQYKPIIHIEAHGWINEKDSDSGFKIEPSGDYVSWKEIEGFIRLINIRLKNTLFITLGICFGARLQLTLDPSKPASFFEMITPFGKISNTEIIEGYTNFYQALLFKNQLIEEVKLIKKNDKFKFYGSANLYEDYIAETQILFKPETFEKNKKLALNKIDNEIKTKDISFEEYKELIKKRLILEKDRFLMIDIYPSNRERFVKINQMLQMIIEKFA